MGFRENLRKAIVDWLSKETGASKEKKKETFKEHHGWRPALAAVAAVGMIALVGYASAFYGHGFRSIAAITLLLAGSGLLVGGLVGFLFGIPRSLQRSPLAAAPDAAAKSSTTDPAYRPNTNLEEISDWLTKILVGVSLTQINHVYPGLVRLSTDLGPAVGGAEVGPRVVIAIAIYFPTCGFLFGYLWTRLFLGGALAEADAISRVEKRLDAQQQQMQTDAAALSLVYQQLRPTDNRPTVSIDDMKAAIRGASPGVKVQVFYQAEKLRSESWKDDKPAMERTTPIFEALVESDPEGRFHRNCGQLGYALKDAQPPRWKEAEAALTRAIKIRGAWQTEGWVFYEFNRAVCRIQLDEQSKVKMAGPELKRKILEDLKAVREAQLDDLLLQSPVAEWLKLNQVTAAELD